MCIHTYIYIYIYIRIYTHVYIYIYIERERERYTGVCNFGKLNFYLGKRAFDEGRASLYPNIDFCKNPGAICEDSSHSELKWVTGIYFWLESVQTYPSGGWTYMDNIRKWDREPRLPQPALRLGWSSARLRAQRELQEGHEGHGPRVRARLSLPRSISFWAGPSGPR